MVAGTPSTEALPWRRRAGILATGCVYLLVAGAAVHGVRLFVHNPMSASLLAALAVVFVAGRAGIRSEPGGPAARRRAAASAGLVAAVVAVSVLAATALGASLGVTTPTLSLAFGTAEAVALGFVLEVWLHGIPLEFARRAALPPALAIAYAVAAGVAAVMLTGEVRLTGLVLTVAAGTFFAGLWWRTGDAWAPVTAHFAWIWLADVLFAGEVFDLGGAAGLLSHAPNAHGAAAWVATAGFALLGVASLRGWPPLAPASLSETEAPTPRQGKPAGEGERRTPGARRRRRKAKRDAP